MATSLAPWNGRCPRYRCGKIMDASTDVMTGRSVWICRPCERNKAGLCMDCPRPLPTFGHCGRGTAKRCPVCRARVILDRERRRAQTASRKKYLAALEKKRWAGEAGRAALRKKNAAYHAAHPYTDVDRRIRRIRAEQRRVKEAA